MRFRVPAICLIYVLFPLASLHAQATPAQLIQGYWPQIPDGVDDLDFVKQTVSPVLQVNSPITIAVNFAKPTALNIFCSFSNPYYTCTNGNPGFFVLQSYAFEVKAPGGQISGYPEGTPSGGGQDECINDDFKSGTPSSPNSFSDSNEGFDVPIQGYFYYSTPGVKTVTYSAFLCTPDGQIPSSPAATLKVTFAIGPALVDPVPNLVSNSAVTTNLQALATATQLVQGVAADGVTEVVIRIPVAAPDQFALTVINDQGKSSESADEDGALGNLGDTTFSQNQVTVTAQGPPVNNTYYAFAVYRAPIDFARGGPGNYSTGTCMSVSNTDDQLACRSVTIQIQDLTNTNNAATPLQTIIVRPPVTLIHGLWSDSSAWNNFSPLVTGSSYDPRFAVSRVNYATAIRGTILSTDPLPDPLFGGLLGKLPGLGLTGNSLGLDYNAPDVLQQIENSTIKPFKLGQNPVGIPVAAVQTDIVGHSMGGLIARDIASLSTFLNSNNYGQGNIHKLITIDSPHLGSPLATQLLTSPETCLAETFLPTFGNFVFKTVTLPTGNKSGAISDLSGDGVGGTISAALKAIAAPGSHPIPTAFIAGVYTDFASSNGTFLASLPFLRCGDPLSQMLYTNSTAWPSIFNDQPNDAIVSENSQLNGSSGSPNVYSGIHSGGTERLGFSGPSVLDSGTSGPGNPIPFAVIAFLNTPANNQGFFQPLNP